MGCFDRGSPDDDAGLRQNSLDAMANDIANNFPDPNDEGARATAEPLPASGSNVPMKASSDQGIPAVGDLKYPRVSLPEVEDEMSQAVREVSPGYIAQAFHYLRQHLS